METVIKTGRQIVQKQQTENPKELDERLTALKLQYNELGAKVSVFNIKSCTGKVKSNIGVVSNGIFSWFLSRFFQWERRSGGKGNNQQGYSVTLKKKP